MTTTNDNGGPAFPHLYQPYGGSELHVDKPGMNLLDWFAGQALMGIAASGSCLRNHAEAMADNAYVLADAMLAEKRRRESTHD